MIPEERIPGEVETLVGAYVEGDLTEAEAIRLKAELRQRPGLARIILAQLEMDVLVRHAVSQPEWVTGSKPSLPFQERPYADAAGSVRQPERPWRLDITSRSWLAMAACFAVLAMILVWGWPHQAEMVLMASGDAIVELERASLTLKPTAMLKLLANDKLMVSGSTAIQIKSLTEATHLNLMPGTVLKILPWSRGKKFELLQGEVRATVASQPLGKPMVLRTAEAEARIVGTQFSLRSLTNETRLEVDEGIVAIRSLSGTNRATVSAGHYALVATNDSTIALPLTGSVTREYWTKVSGDSWARFVFSKRFAAPPDGTNILHRLEGESDWGDNYGARIRGYLHPPATGEYTFWIAADDDASFWLSRDDSADHRVQIAHAYQSAPRDWGGKPSQQSAPVSLTAGQKYYFQIIHKAALGHDHLAVAWTLPGTAEPTVISGEFLSPQEGKAVRGGHR